MWNSFILYAIIISLTRYTVFTIHYNIIQFTVYLHKQLWIFLFDDCTYVLIVSISKYTFPQQNWLTICIEGLWVIYTKLDNNNISWEYHRQNILLFFLKIIYVGISTFDTTFCKAYSVFLCFYMFYTLVFF